jgi:hypothetical protein
MRGAFADQGGLFSYISPEARVPPNHPLRKIRALESALARWNPARHRPVRIWFKTQRNGVLRGNGCSAVTIN